MSGTVIVGGGLAGAFAAALLAKLTPAPLVLERSAGAADKVCGEFLSVEAQAYLRRVGLDLDRLGAVPVTLARFASGKRLAEARLPFGAVGLSRRRLDEALLWHAERLGARVSRGVTVRRVGPEMIETSAGELRAARIILASGKHDVRGARRESDDADWGMIGFKTYFEVSRAAQRAMKGAVELVLFDGGYAGLQLVEDGRLNLCLLVRETHFAALGRTWPALLARLLDEPHLHRRLADANEASERPLAVGGLPFGWLRGASPGPALYPVGDQAAVIASFTGDGMSIALHSAQLAARAIERGMNSGRYLAALRADLARSIGLASWLQRRAETWPGRAASVAAMAAIPPLFAHLARATRIRGGALAAGM
jgi:flavin-dependent dehydrogenase